MGANRSILSAGRVIHAALTSDEDVMSRANKVYPIVEDKATLPYIVFYRTSLGQDRQKTLDRADTAIINVECYTADYNEGVDLAEAVRACLDGMKIAAGGLNMRSCFLTDAKEDFVGDAAVQLLVFECKM